MTYFTLDTAELWAYVYNERLGILEAVPGRETPEEIMMARMDADEAVRKVNSPSQEEVEELARLVRAVEASGMDGAAIYDYETFHTHLLIKYPFWKPHEQSPQQ